ncbi:MAG: VOC family protein [Pseudonocardiaceae bacterium]
MPIRTDPWPAGTPCWVDLAVPDVAAATQFYAAVLGWTYSDTGEEYGHYQMCQRDGRSAAGIGPSQQEGQPPVWTTYLASDAVDTTAKQITENGGTLLVEPFDIPKSGRLCVALDPQGAAFGVWQAGEHIGAEIYNEPGSLVWNEAAVPDPDAARQFYSAVFGYSYQPVDGAGSGYTTFHREGDPLGGMGGLENAPAGAPPHWMAYFVVDDADVAVAAATERGATVLSGPFDTPYGRMVMITDPQGATFAIMGVMPAG